MGGTISNCFWDIDTSGLGTSDGGTGLSTAQMQEASTYLSAGWDFVGETINGPNDIWTIKEGFDYPRHVWKIVNFVGWDGVDFKDYRFFAEQWGQTGCSEVNDCSSTDLDFSGSVDSNDLRIFTTYWLSGK
ncbi:MAG: hypothetical protein AMJ75_01170 [Phycisphaerae bacterium SM1_79]|nr:MAG: hypothetical protein AMJ75_01170 [Phycisphaerae bacterium SM1_79]